MVLMLGSLSGMTVALPGLAQPASTNPASPLTARLAISQSQSLVAQRPSSASSAEVPTPPLLAPGTSTLESTEQPSPSPSLATNSSELALDAYTLGPGDQISIEVLSTASVFAQPIEQTVLVDGTLTMPWIGKVNVFGLTPLEAESLIVSTYSQYIKTPRITFQLLQPRPVRITISGEVERSGSYTFPINADVGQGSINASDRSRYWPSLTDAISSAGGITRTADVRSIQVQRVGMPAPIETNLWELLQNGDLTQDLLLRDGDSISISAVETLDSTEASTLADTTFSPEVIAVNVVGEVDSPGSISVPPNTPLNQALLAAGGINNVRGRRNAVELVRLNPDGSVLKRSVSVDLNESANPENNPILQSGDTIVVSRSGLAATSDTLGLIFSPLTNLLFNIFGN